MDKKQEAFLLELLNDFKVEATEHHQAIVNGLIELEKNPSSSSHQTVVETTFREIHSMKGAARAVNLVEIERLCQSIESVFHQLKSGSIELTSSHFDALYQAADLLGVILTEIDLKEKSTGANTLSMMMKRLDMLAVGLIPPQSIEVPANQPLRIGKQITTASDSGQTSIADLKKVQADQEPAEIPKPSGISFLDKPATKDTVRISTEKLGTLLREAEEFISVKATLGYYIREIKKRQVKELFTVTRDMEHFHHSLSRMIDDLLLDIKTTLLYPFTTILDIVPKLVRDLAKEYGKEINLTMRGGEIEIDRRILEEIKDPVIHLIRNCIDHGIETTEIRKKAGKSEAGTIELTIKQESVRQVVMNIRDDGIGIDRERVIQSAIKMGVVQRESADRMDDNEVFSLIFRSGVSTSPFVTDISGRGLGMAIVAEKVLKLGGDIVVSSIPGQGTTFTITLPLTISNFRGIHVQVEDQFFIVPTNFVLRAVRLKKKDIRTVESKQIMILDDESIALVRLGELLGIQKKKVNKDEGSHIPVLILTNARKKIGYIIDNVFGELEGMVKDMGPQLAHVRNISGVTISGDGQVIPIINVPELMDSVSHDAMALTATDTIHEDETSENRQKYILVAEDSITLRSLLKNIIESAGYLVKTAVNGMEAYEFLKNEVFDLVVSDVEMPRMNGFDLTAKIRADKSLSETPVILVTALDSPDDRQRGMESGANAYIVKGSFEQSNLIETIKRLI